MIESLEDMLIRHEGLRLKPYRDSVGKLTIGVGRNLDDVGITEEEARYLLKNDIQKAVAEAKRFPWYAKLNNPRKQAIIDMIYNLGASRFLGFKKMLAALEAGDYEAAAREMLDSKWAQQVGRRATELAEIMRTGELRGSV